ncbi:hypothetical protein N7456_007627 [Penicillium angulare]|uniref:Uncharacterized protein n=1 Tax=Penicillium angulare TaxID=116970 RepID=A0A9W9FAY7_9EURO|nr:hypothetical protein N7456_007627 [Penicillium angulare]
MSSSDSTFETLALGFRDLIRVPGRFTAPKHYGQSVPEQKPRYQLKRTTPNRRERVEYRLQYGLQLKYDRQIFIGLILNDFVLRGISQRIEKLQKEMRISEKISDDRDEFEDHKVLRDLQKQYALQEHDLYISETRIPQLPLKQNYDLIRTNPTWIVKIMAAAVVGSAGAVLNDNEFAGRQLGIVLGSASAVLATEDMSYRKMKE